MFDGPNLVSHASLAPVLRLAERAGLAELIGDCSTLPVANVVPKARTVLAGMLAGADSVDDLDLLRAGGTERLLGAVRAPSTIGTFLRSFTHGHVLQLGKVNRLLLARLIAETPGLTGTADGLVFVDMDERNAAIRRHRWLQLPERVSSSGTTPVRYASSGDGARLDSTSELLRG